MEDGSDDNVSSAVILPSLNNGEVTSVMANFPNIEDTIKSPLKVNGDSNQLETKENEGKDSSDCDTLVIDESVKPPKKKKLKKLLNKEEEFTHTNPYFSESIFDLSTQYQKPDEKVKPPQNINTVKKLTKPTGKKGKNGKPKLREYAQYLGLQPTVQFKCSKCTLSGFQSLQALNEHLTSCTSKIPTNLPTPIQNNTTNFRVTRKVFLCSACGTYYENWNLFLHMREVHKRFICLYCLGMFPHAEKLSLHLISKHNCTPNHFETPEDFFYDNRDPCFLMCCECQVVFNEQDDFFHHNCINNSKKPVTANKLVLNTNTSVDLNESEEKTTNIVNEKTDNVHEIEDKVLENTDILNTDLVNNVKKEVDENELVNTVTLEVDNMDNNKMNEKTIVEPCEKISENQMSNMIVDNCNDEENFTNNFDKEIDENVIRENNFIENEDGTVKNVGEIVTSIQETENNIEPEEEEDKSNYSDNNSLDNEQLGVTETDQVDDLEKLDSLHADDSEKEEIDDSLEDNYNEADDLEEEPMLLEPETLSEPDEQELEEQELEEQDIEEPVPEEQEPETRKVPKITVKLPKITAYSPDQDEEEYQSEDSEKLTMEIEKESDQELMDLLEDELDDKVVIEEEIKAEISVPTAGGDISIIELELEQPLDKFDIQLLLQKCLRATTSNCLFCNHARKIAVNGKQLGLHAIAEHRYAAIVKSITAEELIPESFNTRIKESFNELENLYFNLDSSSSEGGVTFSHIFECFQCRYSTTIHKELYLHNRKLHAKAILLCIMCKTSFYSYSELICHLCPGLYALENDVRFRCCLCVSGDLPSAFRLMVHLRKKHHVCDVCLEMCHNQSRLSNHVWKHKLHHLCYRCGIAYRNKPDITKHLFWKHGTESVLCKRCLQKKWPHVYHFCIPPTSFACEECSLSFTQAVSLMVHKRLHSELFPHGCSEDGCTEKFISKKLLLKHEFRHREPPEEVKKEEEIKVDVEVPPEIIEPVAEVEAETISEPTKAEIAMEEKPIEKPKPKVDVYDLPELNLSESDSSESEEEVIKPKVPEETALEVMGDGDKILDVRIDGVILEATTRTDDKVENPVPILENIWDDFKNYQANIGKLDILTDVGTEPAFEASSILSDIPPPLTIEDVLRDHDYCAPTMDVLKEEEGLSDKLELSADHDYCTARNEEPKIEPPEKLVSALPIKKSSSSSSGSDSSSCTCGSNCSCSSSSGSSSSTSDSSESDSSSEEGRRRQQVRRERRRTKRTKKEVENKPPVEILLNNAKNQAPILMTAPPVEAPIQESDLETTETDTDEDFYDKEPQKLANKLLAEKREKLMQQAGIGPYINGSMIDSRPSTPSLPEGELNKKPKKVKKLKKKKKKKKSKRERNEIVAAAEDVPTYPTVASMTLIIPKNSPNFTPTYSPISNSTPSNSNLTHAYTPNSATLSENDSNTRASKRRRVPNRFYGYSSDEDGEKPIPPPVLKWRKVDLPTPKSPLVVPPITIKTTASMSPQQQIVEPISIRMSTKPGELRVAPLRVPFPRPPLPKMKPMKAPSPEPVPAAPEPDSGTESNTSSDEEEIEEPVVAPPPQPKKDTPALYCYCRCPYDEVSEMIGCDSDDCNIEWFHFECVGIMVPPKGQWYCPDCRKKKQQRRDLLQAQMSL